MKISSAFPLKHQLQRSDCKSSVVVVTFLQCFRFFHIRYNVNCTGENENRMDWVRYLIFSSLLNHHCYIEDVNENEKSSTTKTLIIIHKFLYSLLIMTSVGEMNVNKLKEYSISQMVKRELLSERNTFIILKLGENLDKSAGVSTKQKNLWLWPDVIDWVWKWKDW